MALLCYGLSFSQTFNYQAVVRDAADAPVTNQSVSVWIAIRIGSPTGSIVYNEVHNVTSNNQGVITLPIGGGTSGANFLGIDWTQQNQWLEIRVDVTGGTNYVVLGAYKLQHVPYALHALTSGSSTDAGPFDYTGGVISNANGNIQTDDFVFGSPQLDGNGQFSNALNNRMFFDKSKAAFRAGYTPQDEWDEANVGDYSVAFGEGGIASGRNSFSMGSNANATGIEGVAFGTNAGGFGDYSRGFGVNARAYGENATAIGRQLSANSMAEIQLGQYSKFVAGSADTWVPTDRLFVIGNGQEDANQALNSDALVMLKNGNTTLNGTFTIDGDNQGSGASYTLPAQDGTLNQIMQTDGSGNVSWVTPAAAAIPNGGNNGEVLSTDGSGVLSWVTNDDADADPTNEIELPTQTGEDGKFLRTDGTAVSWQDVPNELPTGGTNGQVLTTDGSGVYSWADQTATAGFTTSGNVTSNSPGDTATDDFVFGSTQIDDIPGLEDNNRIVFDKSNSGAFRAGSAFNTNRFDQDQMGTGSVAFGVNNLASGSYAASTGFFNTASGYASYAHGERNIASASHAVISGADNTVTGSFARAHGRYLTSESLYQTTFGVYNTAEAGSPSTFVETDRLFVIGNGTSDMEGINNSDALVMLKNGNTTLNGELTIDGDNQGSGAAYTLPAQDGTANQVMTTDGSGNVSWATVSGGGASLPAGGNNGDVLQTDGSGNYTWVSNNDGDSDDTNEIELPTQTGQSGKVLSTDGTSPSWVDTPTELPAGGTNGQILSTDGSGNYSWVNDAGGTSLPAGGNNGDKLTTDGSGGYSWTADAVDDADADPTNELELPAQTGQAGKILSTDGSAVSWVDDAVNDADADPTNEIELPAQAGQSGKILSTNGTAATWVDDAVNDADADPTNEIELPTQAGQSGKVLSTNGTAATWVDDAVNDADADPTNEIELPVGGSNGQVLQTDGSGNYTWTNKDTALPAVTGPAFTANWENYSVAHGTGFEDGRYYIDHGRVYLGGLIRKTSAIATGDVMLTLPVGYRPLKQRLFTVTTEAGIVRVDVAANGNVIYNGIAHNGVQNWVSLDGISFRID